MRIAMFYHSLVSDWNHGNAHFLRGVIRELQLRGHQVQVYEPADNWSLSHLQSEQGAEPFRQFAAAYPDLSSEYYTLDSLDLDEQLRNVDLVLVHEWNAHELVARIGRHRAQADSYLLLFHDTHHRSATAPAEMAAYDLSRYDGVLAFGRVIRDRYLDSGWTRRGWTWHEAADVSTFYPRQVSRRTGDLVWVGNWGDNERDTELRTMLLGPAQELRLTGSIHGVRYPPEAIDAVHDAGLEYHGWLANFQAPEVFAAHRFTVHVPRRAYVESLPGIPTIRPFEALASGIPLVSAYWNDAEGLFSPGKDYLVARDGQEMTEHMRAILSSRELATDLAEHGRETILARHTCAHRVDELFEIVQSFGLETRPASISN